MTAALRLQAALRGQSEGSVNRNSGLSTKIISNRPGPAYNATMLALHRKPGRPRLKSRQHAFRLPSLLSKALDKAARESGSTQTAIVEAALSAYFGLNGAGNGASAGKG